MACTKLALPWGTVLLQIQHGRRAHALPYQCSTDGTEILGSIGTRTGGSDPVVVFLRVAVSPPCAHKSTRGRRPCDLVCLQEYSTRRHRGILRARGELMLHGLGYSTQKKSKSHAACRGTHLLGLSCDHPAEVYNTSTTLQYSTVHSHDIHQNYCIVRIDAVESNLALEEEALFQARAT